MVVPGQTGYHFAAGDIPDLRRQVEWCSRHPAEVRQLRSNARAAFEAKYTGRAALESLLAIYRQALQPQA